MPPLSVNVDGEARQLEGDRAPTFARRSLYVAQGVYGRRSLLDGMQVDDQFVRVGSEGREGG